MKRLGGRSPSPRRVESRWLTMTSLTGLSLTRFLTSLPVDTLAPLASPVGYRSLSSLETRSLRLRSELRSDRA